MVNTEENRIDNGSQVSEISLGSLCFIMLSAEASHCLVNTLQG